MLDQYCVTCPPEFLRAHFIKFHLVNGYCELCKVAEKITGVPFSKVREEFFWMDGVGDNFIRPCIWSIGVISYWLNIADNPASPEEAFKQKYASMPELMQIRALIWELRDNVGIGNSMAISVQEEQVTTNKWITFLGIPIEICCGNLFLENQFPQLYAQILVMAILINIIFNI